ncbi:MAG: NRDE family protein [Proteobacteria bacterium]|nr:NRDE family protein [Pseudomonadota bacterium]
MCTAVILIRPGHRWPVIMGLNRDELTARPWKAPARHWPDRPGVIAGLDRRAGGSWLGLNRSGVMAGILNREGSLGPEAGKRSRGELVLEALDHADALAAAEALAAIEPASYRAFNLVVADNSAAYWLRSRGFGPVEVREVPTGLSMLAANEMNDGASPRIRAFLPRFREALPPDPGRGDWRAWEALLASREHAPEDGPRGAMTVVTEGGYGTVSSSLIALPAPGAGRPVWRFAAGRPGEAPYRPVDLD